MAQMSIEQKNLPNMTRIMFGLEVMRQPLMYEVDGCDPTEKPTAAIPDNWSRFDGLLRGGWALSGDDIKRRQLHV